MYSSKKMYEVESMIKQHTNELALTHFATISAIKGRQFGREIFSSVIPFKDLKTFMEVFPDVQREVSKRRIASIKTYILSGLEDPASMRFFSAITVTCRGHVFYDEDAKRIAIDTNQSKLSINDGQHRFYAISEAIRELEGKINKAKDEITIEKLKRKLSELKNMIVPIVIFNQIGEREEKQLFSDLNLLAQRPSRSATIKLDQTDFISQMARELANENKFLKMYGVEMDKMSIQENNPNLILLTTVYAFIKELFLKDYHTNRNFITDSNYIGYKNIIDNTLNTLFHALPSDVNVKGKYIIEKNYSLKGMAKFIHKCRYELNIQDKQIFKTIKQIDWTPTFTSWSMYGATKSKGGKLQFGGSGNNGILAVYDNLMETLEYPKKLI